MKTYWLIVFVLIASCASPKLPIATATTVQKGILTLRPAATLTPTQPPKIRTSTASPVISTQEVSTAWKTLASQLRVKAQQAKTGDYWEDIRFREEAYQLCDDMITASAGQQKVHSKEILKHWRWGIEFMNQRELDEVIRLIDQHN